MKGYFKIPVVGSYIDVNTATDFPMELIYDKEMKFAYVYIEYTEKRESWVTISREEFESHTPKQLEPDMLFTPQPEITPEPTNREIMAAINNLEKEIKKNKF